MTGTRHLSEVRWDAQDAAPFIGKLTELMRSFSDCDLLIYQAGADPHIADPLGGFLTTA